MDHISEDEACKISFVRALRDTLNVVSGKWTLAIVCTLLRGTRRRSDTERLLAGISSRMLARELRELEINGIVVRVQRSGASKVTSCQLTPSGQKLEQVIIGMAGWGVLHRVATAKHLALPQQLHAGEKAETSIPG